jgi:hypothetical protein
LEYAEGKAVHARGTAKGKIIELDEALPYVDGCPVRVTVEPEEVALTTGSPAAIRQVMHEAPHLATADLEALDQAIEAGRLPVQEHSAFEDGQ